MASVMTEFEHLKIRLEELKKATNNFGSKVIGSGGFGKVYGGEVSHSRGRSKVAIKRLSREFGQGDPEFLKEIMMLSRYTHKNLISLLGFCDEDGEKILVYEHASNGSLDRHLNSSALTWTQRLKICLDVAKGLAYLHDHKGTQQRVLHRDVKSANILLDENWNAKLSDMGLSKLGPANQPHTVLFTNVVGTPGYCDPQYMEKYSLTKESDIYSFGVVLFEVLCGRLCFTYTNSHLEILVPMWKQSYEHKQLDRIMFKDLTPNMNPTSLETFSNIAFQCLHFSREQRPTMSLLVETLEMALHQQRQEKGLVFSMDEVVETIGGTLVCFYGEYAIRDLWSAKFERTGGSIYVTDYKAATSNGDQVAITRLRKQFSKNDREFQYELNLVAEIKHPNLLRMRAYYLGPEGRKLLVYDYMPKGSLAALLHGPGPKTRLSWPTRMQIAKGVARGLLSLHTHHNIIHGNLTSHNVWLDENLNPKISNLGLSRLMTATTYSNMLQTTRTLGYQAPEVSMRNKVDRKSDVYSFGVIMLELLTGKSPGDVDLPRWVDTIVKEQWNDKVFDHEMMKVVSARGEVELSKSLQLALKCVHQSPHDRPHFQLVLELLEAIRPETTTSSG